MIISQAKNKSKASFTHVQHLFKYAQALPVYDFNFVNTLLLTVFFPMFPFDPPEKSKGFLTFWGASEGNMGKKRVNAIMKKPDWDGFASWFVSKKVKKQVHPLHKKLFYLKRTKCKWTS